jgi:hypothetical protein
MYTHHPKETEFFDYHIFETENYESLRRLLNEVCDLIPGSWSDDDIVQQRASLMTMGVYSNLDTFKDESFEIDDDLETNESAAAFFEKMILTCVFMHLEDIGIAERGEEGGWRVTNFGKQHGTRLAKKKTALLDFLERE